MGGPRSDRVPIVPLSLSQGAAVLSDADVVAHSRVLLERGNAARAAVAAIPVVPATSGFLAVSAPEPRVVREAVEAAMGVLAYSPPASAPHVHTLHCAHAANDAGVAAAYKALPVHPDAVQSAPAIPTFECAAAGAFELSPDRTSAKKLLESGWQGTSLLLGPELRPVGEDAVAATVTVTVCEGPVYGFVGLIRSDINPATFPEHAYNNAGFGHRMHFDGRKFSGPEAADGGAYNWGQETAYTSAVPLGTGVSVRLRPSGDVHFIVGGVDKGPAGKVPVAGGLRYRLLVEVQVQNTVVAIAP